MDKDKMDRDIYITAYDLERLKTLIADGKAAGKDVANLDELEKELERASVVDSREIPPDVITMNSRVRLRDLDTGEEMTLTLVFPGDADIDQGKISVLAPVGTGMLGYRVGDVLEWEVPAGLRRLQILEVIFQPEAAGRYDL
ncbi:MAG: nucleoside diphosphate kinase regulator [Actinobacteria bacterium]|nr:nucleoside diphosphate kinase regulator [Actinomycetota bacterium]